VTISSTATRLGIPEIRVRKYVGARSVSLSKPRVTAESPGCGVRRGTAWVDRVAGRQRLFYGASNLYAADCVIVTRRSWHTERMREISTLQSTGLINTISAPA
jgi:hypothetical protein